MSNRGNDVEGRKVKSGDGVPRPTRSVAAKLKEEISKRSVTSKLGKPAFANEAEEADWYPAHPEYAEALFRQAEKEEKLGSGTVSRIFGLTKPVTIRLSEEDIMKARVQAEMRGVKYQTYMKMLLHKALAKGERKASSTKRIAA